jgi:hypothetical protein
MSPKVKNTVLGAIAIVAFGAAIAVFVMRNPESEYMPRKLTMRGVCLETKQDVTVTFNAGEQPPYVNPATGRRTVYSWYICPECKKRFVPKLVFLPGRDLPQPEIIPKCPLCGGDAAAWNPDDPNQPKPVGDVPPPDMPG